MKKEQTIKDTKFKIPENYFQNFNDELLIRIIEENLKDRYGNNNPFTVPENYFNLFSVKLETKTNKTGKVIQILKPYLSIAAGILLILGLWQVILTNTNNDNITAETIDTINNNTLNFDNIELADLSETVDDYIDNEDVYDVVNSEEDTEQEIELNASEDEISDYLIDYADENDFDEILASL